MSANWAADVDANSDFDGASQREAIDAAKFAAVDKPLLDANVDAFVAAILSAKLPTHRFAQY